MVEIGGRSNNVPPSNALTVFDIRQISFRLTDQNSKWYESTELWNPQGRMLNTKVFALINPSQVQRKVVVYLN